MSNDESEKAEGYLSLHDVCDPVNGGRGLDSALCFFRIFDLRVIMNINPINGQDYSCDIKV